MYVMINTHQKTIYIKKKTEKKKKTQKEKKKQIVWISVRIPKWPWPSAQKHMLLEVGQHWNKKSWRELEVEGSGLQVFVE